MRSAGLAHLETVDDDPIFAGVNISAQYVDARGGQRAGQLSKQTLPIARADRELGAVIALWHSPFNDKPLVAHLVDQPKMANHLIGISSPEIPFRHHCEMFPHVARKVMRKKLPNHLLLDVHLMIRIP